MIVRTLRTITALFLLGVCGSSAYQLSGGGTYKAPVEHASVPPSASPRLNNLQRANRGYERWTIPTTTSALPVTVRAVTTPTNSTRPTSVTAPPATAPGDVLNRIMQCESSGIPTNQNSHSTASGLFGVLDSTWDGYAGFERAMDAPSDVQWAWAREAYAASGTTPWNASRGCWAR